MNKPNFKTHSVDNYLPKRDVGNNYYFKENYADMKITSHPDKSIHEKETFQQKEKRLSDSKRPGESLENNKYVSNPHILPKITGTDTNRNENGREIVIVNRNFDSVSNIIKENTILPNSNFGPNSNLLYTEQYRNKIINSNNNRSNNNCNYISQMRK
jgi:hypothetical protein